MIAVILAGGAGRRLWPLSSPNRPKHVLKLFDGLSLFQKTALRLSSLKNGDKPLFTKLLVITNPVQRDILSAQLDELKIKAFFLIEPCPMNTAPAIGLAVFHEEAAAELKTGMPESNTPESKDDVLMFFPADHLIGENDKLEDSLICASITTENKMLATIGIEPTHPETGYGYIKYNSKNIIAEHKSRHAFEVSQFVEKPDKQTAEKYLKMGNFLWNAGIFVAKKSLLVSMYERFLPRTAKNLRILVKMLIDGKKYSSTDKKEVFEACDKTSIDIGLIEKIENIATINADFTWNDLGSFDSFYRVLEKDGKGNVIIGKATVKGCTDSLFISSGNRVIGARGVKGHLIAESNQGVLVIPRNSSQVVREISEDAERLKAKYTARDVEKPWGSFHVLTDEPGYKSKKLVILPGASLSLQMHHRREEKWIIVKGIATATVGNKVHTLKYGESISIPFRTKHRVENRGNSSLEIIEVQTGTYFGEDDIIRYEDIYDRL